MVLPAAEAMTGKCNKCGKDYYMEASLCRECSADARHWICVAERLPKVEQSKPPEYAWLVTDGKRIWTETCHPAWWNLVKEGEWPGPTITHWMELPDFPVG